MNETLLVRNKKVYIPLHSSQKKDRQGGGGIEAYIADQYKDSSGGACQEEDEQEHLMTLFECFSPAISVVNYYVQQINKIK